MKWVLCAALFVGMIACQSEPPAEKKELPAIPEVPERVPASPEGPKSLADLKLPDMSNTSAPLNPKLPGAGEVPGDYKGARVLCKGVKANGGIKGPIVHRLVRTRMGQFKYCYESGLKSNPKLTGEMVLGFTIDETGKPSTATTEKSTLGGGPIERCVIDVIGRMVFPSAGKATEAEMTMEFGLGE